MKKSLSSTHLITMVMCMWIIVGMLQLYFQLFEFIPHSGDVGSDNDLILDGKAGDHRLYIVWH